MKEVEIWTYIVTNVVDRHQANSGKDTKHDPQHVKLGSAEKLER